MNIHFIAIGGAAMHNLALALQKKGIKITGSDDEIFEPSLGRLKSHGLLPDRMGWDSDRITNELDAVILGMHAREDNPELIKARELKLPIYSYPEYLYEQTKEKVRVVIGGSHGKTTITAMVMHVLQSCEKQFDYMVGANVDGFDTMVSLTHEAPIAVFEGDEYLSSPIDRTPKFHKYHPQIALLTGVAWDHINVFPTWSNYVEQFQIFADSIPAEGTLIYFSGDGELEKIAATQKNRLQLYPYNTLPYEVEDGKTVLNISGNAYPLHIFGEHNIQNISGAFQVCKALGVGELDFFRAIMQFKGASKRLQELSHTDTHIEYLDFAHSPSKLKATVKAVKSQYPMRKLTACMELHTFSSLSKAFLQEYEGCMKEADCAVVYFNPEVIKHKKLDGITASEIKVAFGDPNMLVFSDSELMRAYLKEQNWSNHNLLFMSSGNFSGIDFLNWSE